MDGGATGSTGGTTGPSSGPSTVLARLLGGPTDVSRYRAGAGATRLRLGGILKQRANESRTGIVSNDKAVVGSITTIKS